MRVQSETGIAVAYSGESINMVITRLTMLQVNLQQAELRGWRGQAARAYQERLDEVTGHLEVALALCHEIQDLGAAFNAEILANQHLRAAGMGTVA